MHIHSRGKLFSLLIILFIPLLALGLTVTAQEKKVTMQTSVFVEAPHQRALNKLEEVYEEKNPDVNIEIYGDPYAKYWDNLTTQIISGTEADIVQIYASQITQYYTLEEGGAFVNLDDRIRGTELENLVGQEASTYDGEYVALSNYAFGNTGIFYRKSILEEAGIEPSDIDTFQDLIDASIKITEMGEDVYGIGAVLGSHSFVYDEWMRMLARGVSNGFYFPDGESPPYTAERINVNDPANVWAAEVWQDLVEKAAPSYAPDKKNVREHYWAGRVAFNMDGPWFIGMTREKSQEVLEDTGLIPHPPIKYEGELHKAKPAASYIIHMLSKDAKHPEEAWKFMKWMASEEAQEIIAVSGMVPSNTEFSGTEAYKEEYRLASQFLEFSDQYEIVNDPAVKQFGELEDEAVQAAQEMFIEGKDPEEVLDKAAENMKEIMEK